MPATNPAAVMAAIITFVKKVLPSTRGYHLFMDRAFTHPGLIAGLDGIGVKVIGTCKEPWVVGGNTDLKKPQNTFENFNKGMLQHFVAFFCDSVPFSLTFTHFLASR